MKGRRTGRPSVAQDLRHQPALALHGEAPQPRLLGGGGLHLLDRIDLQIPVPRLKPEELSGMESGEPSARVADRVKKARHVQTDRQGRAGLVTLNAHLTPRDLKRFAELDTVSRTLLSDAARKFGLSARAFDKIIRVSRTIADLEGIETIQMHHVAEAIQYRTIDPFASI